MKIDFRTAERKDVDLVRRFFQKGSLNYKGYGVWLPKAIEEFYYGTKEVILGFSEDLLVSALMFQDCKNLKGFKELKSGRTIKEFSRRFFLSFMIRQVEEISRQEGRLGIISDARSTRKDVINLLKGNGYREIARADLYREGYEDVILTKVISNSFD